MVIHAKRFVPNHYRAELLAPFSPCKATVMFTAGSIIHALELTSSPENTRYWFLHLHKARGSLLRKLWWKKNEIFSTSGRVCCLCGEMWVFGFFYLFVCLYLSGFTGEGGKWKGEIKLASAGEYGGISSNFISYNFNLVLPALFWGIYVFSWSLLEPVLLSQSRNCCVCICVFCVTVCVCTPIDIHTYIPGASFIKQTYRFYL